MDQWKLGEAEQRRLSETLHRTHDAREYKRTLAVLECGRGQSKSAVARSLNVTRQSMIDEALRQWESDGRVIKSLNVINASKRKTAVILKPGSDYQFRVDSDNLEEAIKLGLADYKQAHVN